MPRGIPNKPRQPRRNVGQPRDLFKVGDIKEDALAATIAERAGRKGDAEVTGFVKSVIPRFSDWSANQGIKSLSNMAKEFAKPTGGARGSTESRATANGESGQPQPRKRPGRPRKQGASAKSGSEKAQAAGTKRRPGRPRKDRPSA
jgi:hypothetical protein